MNGRAFLLTTHLVVLFLLLPLPPRGSEVFASATPPGILFSSLEETALQANIQKSLTKYYGDNYVEIMPDEQLGLLLLRSSFRNKVLDRASGIVVGESVKAVLAILKIKGKITEATAESIITEAEKLGVQEGISYVNSVLLQNQVKVASGEVRVSIKGREGAESALFQYIIVVDQENKDMVVELYSSDHIPLLFPKGDAIYGTQWDYGLLRTQRHGNNRASPFIFRMETKVEQRSGAWSIADSGRINLEMLYPAEVPRLEIARELPYLLEGYKREILNILQIGERFFELPARHLNRIMDGLRQFAQGAGKIATKISSSISGAFSGVFAFGGGGMGLQIYTEQSGRIPVVVSSDTDQKETEMAPQQTIEEVGQVTLLNEEQEEQIIQEQEKFSPLASVLYPLEHSVDKELVVTVRLSGMDPSKEYDIRVGIETESVLSDAFHQAENRWRSSTFYIAQVAQKVSFIAKDVQLRIRQEHQKFKGTANIVVRLREQGRTGAVLFSGPISLVVPEEKDEETEMEEEQDLSCVNINTASLEDLARITQVGQARAEQIIALRQESLFSSLDDLARVSGIGSTTVATIKEQGLACVEGETVKEAEDKSQEPEKISDIKENFSCVNINTASRGDLLRISRIGETRADQIISLRQQALFSSVQDLSRVSGIGSIIVQVIQEQGLACVGAEAPMFVPVGSIPSPQKKEFLGCTTKQININTAESKDLQMISEIGPSYANQIIELRQEEVFWSLDDLSRVSGISAGGSRLTKIKEQGLACAGPLDYIWVEEEDEQEEKNEQEQEEVSGEDEEDEQIETNNENGDEQDEGEEQEETENENDEDQDEEDQEEENEDEEQEDEEEEELVFPAPGTPQIQTPTTNTTPSWTWEVTESSAGEIEEYLVEWSQNSEFAEGVFSATTREPLFVHETALEQETWYLRVKAKDAEDNLSLFSDSGMVTIEAPSHAVVISEIAWMGTKASPQHEWIELYNNTTEEINLSGWSIKAEDGTPDIDLDGTIESLGFFLLERTSQDTISNIEANLIYTGALNDSGEYLRLYDASSVLVDEIDVLGDWEGFGGKKDKRISMERINPLELGSSPANWASNTLFVRNGLDKDGEPINGTPGGKNSVSYEETIILSERLTQLYG
ncbi:MAG: helix-hairpin-helix domain-containing protein, partial [bacterium]|nr:helix-hairpin-helix domain-containing protein [bacterium]